MEDTKNFLQSKTIIGSLILIVSMLLPMFGIEFSADEAENLSGKVAAALDAGAEVFGLILIIWGRFTAKKALTVLPSPTKIESPWFVSAIVTALFFLTGCVGSAEFEEKSPVEKLRASYDAALPLVAVYLALPPCDGDVVGLCANAKVVAALTDATLLAESYLAKAETAETLPAGERDKALRDAQKALSTLLTIYAVQALAKTST